MSNGTNLAAVSGLLGWAVFRALTNRSIAAAAQAVGYPSTHCLPTDTGGLAAGATGEHCLPCGDVTCMYWT